MHLPDYAFSPLTYALLLALLLIVVWRPLPRALRWIGVAIELLLWCMIAPVGANLLVGAIESRAPSPSTCTTPMPSTIVLLDGGTDRRPQSDDDFAALNATSLRRLFAAVALWQRMPNARLVISGGGAGVPHAILLRGLAERMGLPAAAIEVEDRSNTTWENAMYTSRLTPAVPRRIWLVTSALHMPRALGAFRSWGFEPCVWSSGSMHVPFGFHPGYFVPQSSSLAKIDLAIHELIGGAIYRIIEWKHRRADAKQSSDRAKAVSLSSTIAPSANP